MVVYFDSKSLRVVCFCSSSSSLVPLLPRASDDDDGAISYALSLVSLFALKAFLCDLKKKPAPRASISLFFLYLSV